MLFIVLRVAGGQVVYQSCQTRPARFAKHGAQIPFCFHIGHYVRYVFACLVICMNLLFCCYFITLKHAF